MLYHASCTRTPSKKVICFCIACIAVHPLLFDSLATLKRFGRDKHFFLKAGFQMIATIATEKVEQSLGL